MKILLAGAPVPIRPIHCSSKKCIILGRLRRGVDFILGKVRTQGPTIRFLWCLLERVLPRQRLAFGVYCVLIVPCMLISRNSKQVGFEQDAHNEIKCPSSWTQVWAIDHAYLPISRPARMRPLSPSIDHSAVPSCLGQNTITACAMKTSAILRLFPQIGLGLFFNLSASSHQKRLSRGR